MSPCSCPHLYVNRFLWTCSVLWCCHRPVLCFPFPSHDCILKIIVYTILLFRNEPSVSTEFLSKWYLQYAEKIHTCPCFMYRSHIIYIQLQKQRQQSSADYKSPEQHVGLDHLWTWSTVCVHQKMKMFYRSETLICSKCSLYEWISIIGWIPHNGLVHCGVRS